MGPGQAPPPRPPGFPLRPQSFRPNEGQRGYPPNYPNRPRGSQQDQRTSFGPNQLPLYPLERFQVNCAPFRQPTEIGSFSYDEHRNFVMDDSQLKYYFPPDLRTTNNLSVNYEKYISRDSSVDEHIDALLDALMCIKIEEEQQHSSTPERPSITKADFICYRGMLTKIMCTPYAKNDAWEMGATLFNGTIYIEEHVSDEKRNEATSSDERHKLMSYWGYRFETICNISKPVSELRRIKTNKRTLPQQQEDETIAKAPKLDKDATHPGENSTTEDQNQNLEDAEDEFTEQIDLDDPELVGRLDGIVNTNFQYCTVARTRIGRNSIIMGAEVDCISEPKRPSHNPLSDYIELKTSRVISNARNRSTFERHKLLKFWAQSFLPGIPTIIVGFRDDDGNVVTVETFKTMEIPRLVRGKEGAWDSTVCINFLDGVLNFLRKQIVKDDPTVTYTIRWAPPFQAIEVEYAGQRRAFLTERFLKRWGHPPESAASTGG
ncbi:RAT1-interacting protein [Entomortierella parvispora]|uniref:Decapping nuclease n=1 Tax=Entomortierella parvispora TaxID=205924 RepID=A0A9P3HBW4_9FUNG|nr:RAT1-interacting protein [Entomortierella parvispora]